MPTRDRLPPPPRMMPSFADKLALVKATADTLRARGLSHLTAEDDSLAGPYLTLNGQRLLGFGSCSYLGLEHDSRLKHGACDAVLRFGTQFSSSRAYVSAPPYAELQRLLSELVGNLPVVLAPSTTLGHQSALPVLIGAGDAVLFDTLVHSSVQAVLPTLKSLGIPCHPVPHNRLEYVETKARSLARSHQRIFYLCDGVYSMHGDMLGVDELFEVLDRSPELFAYVDDAHGVGWAGRHGAGIVLGRRGIHERMVVALSLAKGFASAGGVLVFPNAELADLVFCCGGTIIFSGPTQPAQLGASIASARIHLSDELDQLQARVRDRIRLFDQLAGELNLPLRTTDETPIRLVEVGDEELAMTWARGLMDAGCYANVAVFPAVPRRRAGLRLMLTAAHEPDHVRQLVAALAQLQRAAPPTLPPSSGIRRSS